VTPAIQQLLGRHFGALSASADAEIAASMQYAYSIAKPNTKPSEPDFVALLVTRAIPAFAIKLVGAFKTIGVQAVATSVFCHGRPQVTHANGTCELGDVLFAYFHTDLSGNEYRNSLLLQAKMSGSAQHTVGKSELHQLGLYTSWGPFKYFRTRSLSGVARSVTPLARHQGAQYLLIDNGGPTNPLSGVSGAPGTYPMGTAAAQRYLTIQRSLGASVIHLLSGAEGRVFKDKQSATSDWDQVVWDLIDHGLNRTFTQQRAGVFKHDRTRHTPIGLALTDSISIVGDTFFGNVLNQASNGNLGPPREAATDAPDDEDGGISLILIETRDERDQDERFR
jgi:hypothetical protein